MLIYNIHYPKVYLGTVSQLMKIPIKSPDLIVSLWMVELLPRKEPLTFYKMKCTRTKAIFTAYF